MREIKFRAWEKHPITEKYNMQSWEQVKSACIEYLSDNETFSNRTIMQYTGLKDKNGVEIYEGDIVECWGGENFNGMFQYNERVNVEDIRYLPPPLEHLESSEVIGNIYQHPELLGTAIGDRGGILSTQEKDTAESPGPQGIAQKKGQGDV